MKLTKDPNMYLTVKNTKGKTVKIKDIMGKTIPCVHSFNTKTCVTRLFIVAEPKGAVVKKGRNGNKALMVKVKIPGAYAEINGIRVY